MQGGRVEKLLKFIKIAQTEKKPKQQNQTNLKIEKEQND